LPAEADAVTELLCWFAAGDGDAAPPPVPLPLPLPFPELWPPPLPGVVTTADGLALRG